MAQHRILKPKRVQPTVHTDNKILHIFSYTYQAHGVPLMTGAGRSVEVRKMFCMRISASDECSLDRSKHTPTDFPLMTHFSQFCVCWFQLHPVRKH